LRTYKYYALLLVFIPLFVLALAGCEGSNTVSGLLVSDRPYTERGDWESAKQPEQLTAGEDIYASVYFIESTKGMEYTAKWSVNGKEVKTDMQKLPTDRKGMIVFSLEGDKVTAGTLKFEICYKEYILASRELVIAEE